MDKQKKGEQTRQKATPKPLKFNKPFYILGIAFSILIVLGVLASIPILATKDQMVSYIFYIESDDWSCCADLSKGNQPDIFSLVDCRYICFNDGDPTPVI